MIRCFGKESLFKKATYLILGSLILLCIFFLGLQYYEMEKLHEKNMHITQQLIGTLAEQYPDKEQEIAKVIFSVKDSNSIEKGKQTLEKYGYGKGTGMQEDILFKDFFYDSLKTNLLLCISIIVLISSIFIYLVRYFISKLQSISLNLDNIIDGNFLVETDNVGEGILSRINFKFQHMARIMDLSLEKTKIEKEKLKSLVTDISHQLKTPLSSIKVYNTLLSEENLTKEENKDFLDRSAIDINKLQGLVDSLLKVSRMESGMIELKIEKNSLKETIINAVNGVYLKASEKNINIVIDDFQECWVFHDSKWTKEAIFNVLENAVKYTDLNGKIKIALVDLVTQVRIDVEDNGIGIREEEFNKIFKRFYRGNSEAVKNTEGSGIGLYLTRKILEEQGGCITVDSIEGRVTKFSLFLQKCYEG